MDIGQERQSNSKASVTRETTGHDLEHSSKIPGRRWIIGITGASGMPYSRRLLQALCDCAPDVHIDLVISDAGKRVIREEEGETLTRNRESLENYLKRSCPQVELHDVRDIGSAIASGSCLTEGMLVAPCSMSTLGAIACGISNNLIHRAADVTLKEGRKLIIVPRETPLSAIHLKNMYELSKLGVAVVAAMPGFYHQPQTIAELVDMMVTKILDQMGIHLNLVHRWGDSESSETATGHHRNHNHQNVIGLKRSK